MGFFSSGSSFDDDVEKATNEKNTSEEWGKIMDICDKVGSSSQHAKECLESIIKRLNNPDPHIALQAATLLDACVNNCGKPFHLVVASRDFEKEYRKLLQKTKSEVNVKLRQILQGWAEGEFSKNPELNLIPSLYQKLKKEGIEFSAADSVKSPKSTQMTKDSNSNASQKEVDDIAKAIELSLKDVPTSPKSKQKAGTAAAAGKSLYPSTALNSTPEGRKVRALYDFEAAEDNELTFKAGEIIHVTDDSDPNWWKGTNKRGEGLFPSNFVTADLSVEPDQPKTERDKKSVQFSDSVKVKKIQKELTEVEINENKMDRLLHYLHEADPRDASGDPMEMRDLAEEVNAMGPLIDAELERVDRKHAQLTQLSSDLVEAFNLYYTLMRESSAPAPAPVPAPGYLNKPGPGPGPGPYTYMVPHQPHPHQGMPHVPQFNGSGGHNNPPYMPPSYPPVMSSLPPMVNGPPMSHFIPDQLPTHPPVNSGVHQFGHPVVGPPAPQPPYHVHPSPQMSQGAPLPQGLPSQAAPYHDKPPLL